jgi:mono/diheme cytochrome c family protein
MRTPGVFVFACLLAACGTDIQTGDDDGTPQPPDGEALLAENCAQCHGADGAGTVDGPSIQSPVRGFATYVIRTGRTAQMGFKTGMDPFDTTKLSDDELNAILDFLSTAPHPTDGAGLYARYCINCHGANARSGRVGKNIVAELAEITIKIRYGHGGTAYSARTSYMPAWPATELSDADIALLKSYIATL